MPEYATYDAFFPSHGACASDKYSIHPCNHGIESLWVMPESQEGAVGICGGPVCRRAKICIKQILRIVASNGEAAGHYDPSFAAN